MGMISRMSVIVKSRMNRVLDSAEGSGGDVGLLLRETVGDAAGCEAWRG